MKILILATLLTIGLNAVASPNLKDLIAVAKSLNEAEEKKKNEETPETATTSKEPEYSMPPGDPNGKEKVAANNQGGSTVTPTEAVVSVRPTDSNDANKQVVRPGLAPDGTSYSRISLSSTGVFPQHSMGLINSTPNNKKQPSKVNNEQ